VGRRSDPDWRDAAATELLLRHLPKLNPGGPVLVFGSYRSDLTSWLESRGLRFEVWNRRCREGIQGSPWPQGGPYGTALGRIPRSKDELLMSLHAVASVMGSTGTVALYGANDEGVKSGADVLAGLTGEVATVATGGRCRVVAGRWSSEEGGDVRGDLSDWKESAPLGPGPFPPDWVSYPGVFAHGRLDEGTRLLLGCLPAFREGAKVLDYGCGSGVVGWEVSRTSPGAVLSLLDTDAVALSAARENVPGAAFLLRDGMPTDEGQMFDAIVSNPPFHRGKGEDPDMLLGFIHDAADRLNSKGSLVFVAQKRMPLEPPLTSRFRTVDRLGEDSTFRVWRGRGPLLGHQP